LISTFNISTSISNRYLFECFCKLIHVDLYANRNFAGTQIKAVFVRSRKDVCILIKTGIKPLPFGISSPSVIEDEVPWSMLFADVLY